MSDLETTLDATADLGTLARCRLRHAELVKAMSEHHRANPPGKKLSGADKALFDRWGEAITINGEKAVEHLSEEILADSELRMSTLKAELSNLRG